MGRIVAICVSERKGTAKRQVPSAFLKKNWGLEGDDHAGKWHRQISLLPLKQAQMARQPAGAFGENLLVSGFDLKNLPIGTRIICGKCLLEITQIGKECHSHCDIYKRTGDCVMPREGIFAVVIKGGHIRIGDELVIEKSAGQKSGLGLE